MSNGREEGDNRTGPRRALSPALSGPRRPGGSLAGQGPRLRGAEARHAHLRGGPPSPPPISRAVVPFMRMSACAPAHPTPRPCRVLPFHRARPHTLGWVTHRPAPGHGRPPTRLHRRTVGGRPGAVPLGTGAAGLAHGRRCGEAVPRDGVGAVGAAVRGVALRPRLVGAGARAPEPPNTTEPPATQGRRQRPAHPRLRTQQACVQMQPFSCLHTVTHTSRGVVKTALAR